MQYQKYL